MDQSFETLLKDMDEISIAKVNSYFPMYKIGYVFKEAEMSENTGGASHSWDAGSSARDNVAPVEATVQYRSWAQDSKSNQGNLTATETANLFTGDMDKDEVIEYVRTSLTEAVIDNMPTQDHALQIVVTSIPLESKVICTTCQAPNHRGTLFCYVCKADIRSLTKDGNGEQLPSMDDNNLDRIDDQIKENHCITIRADPRRRGRKNFTRNMDDQAMRGMRRAIDRGYRSIVDEWDNHPTKARDDMLLRGIDRYQTIVKQSFAANALFLTCERANMTDLPVRPSYTVPQSAIRNVDKDMYFLRNTYTGETTSSVLSIEDMEYREEMSEESSLSGDWVLVPKDDNGLGTRCFGTALE